MTADQLAIGAAFAAAEWQLEGAMGRLKAVVEYPDDTIDGLVDRITGVLAHVRSEHAHLTAHPVPEEDQS